MTENFDNSVKQTNHIFDKDYLSNKNVNEATKNDKSDKSRDKTNQEVEISTSSNEEVAKNSSESPKHIFEKNIENNHSPVLNSPISNISKEEKLPEHFKSGPFDEDLDKNGVGNITSKTKELISTNGALEAFPDVLEAAPCVLEECGPLNNKSSLNDILLGIGDPKVDKIVAQSPEESNSTNSISQQDHGVLGAAPGVLEECVSLCVLEKVLLSNLDEVLLDNVAPRVDKNVQQAPKESNSTNGASQVAPDVLGAASCILEESEPQCSRIGAPNVDNNIQQSAEEYNSSNGASQGAPDVFRAAPCALEDSVPHSGLDEVLLDNVASKVDNNVQKSPKESNLSENAAHSNLNPSLILQTSFENDYSGSKSDISHSTDLNKSDFNSSKSNISEDETDDPMPDNISLSLSIFQEENDRLKSTIDNLEHIISQQQKKLNENDIKLKDFESKFCYAEKVRTDLENRLHLALKQCEFATKEKESTVMRYAISEKSVIEQKSIREQTERKLVEALKEKDLAQHKLAAMVHEKARICQLLDNKTYEYKAVLQDLERTKSDLNNLEVKLKWSQNSLRTEIELHKESAAKVDNLTSKLNEANVEMEKIRKDAQESIKNFYQSQDNRAHVLDAQLKEQQAILILEKHEREERDQQIANLKTEFDKLQNKHQNLIEENNILSVKVQQLERDRLETAQNLSELKGCADKLKQEETTLNSLSASIEQLKLQLQHEKEQKDVNIQQVAHLKERNMELETDMEACRLREADMLIFTQQLTDKNVRLQLEFSSLETKVQQLTCEQNLVKKDIKKYETQIDLLNSELETEKRLRLEETQTLARHLAEKTKLCEHATQQLEDQKGENLVIKRKLELSVREVNKELQHCRKKIENYEKIDNSNHSRSSSSSSLNITEGPSSSSSPINSIPCPENHSDHQIIQPNNALDRQVLIDHIIKLQRTSAKKSEKIDFLEEHVQTLVAELQRKSRLLQSYVLREQAGTLSSNKMDENKAEIAKHNGVMASVFGSKVSDTTLTLELSLDINRKLQAILEDTLLKNITLKENVDTLGAEIARLNKQNIN